MMIEGLDLGILGPAFAAGLLVMLSHVILGREVIKRGIIFIDLAIAQMAGLGVIIAASLEMHSHYWEVQLIAVTSALVGAAILSQTEKLFQQYQEAVIGVSFVLAATAGIILLANNPHGGEHLKEILVGQILWVEWPQLLIPAIISLVVVLLALFKGSLFQTKSFYLLFAIAVTASVQLVGVYLVFASLIIPTLATVKLSDKSATGTAFVIGALAYAAGLILSALFDLPSGAVIVWCMAIIAVVIAVYYKNVGKNSSSSA